MTQVHRPLARLRDLCLDANDPQLVGAFWGAVLGRAVEDAGAGDGNTPDAHLRAGADGGPSLSINGVPEPKTVKDRIHLDITLEPGQEVTDLLRLGATVVAEPGDVRWWVLADPEGNEFCAFLPEADASNDADAEQPTA
jgi:outer membrane lipoprotein SlyB